MEIVVDSGCRSLIEPLTRREIEILGLVCEGHSNQEISRRTGIRLQTVKYHLVHIFGKLGVRRRTQAVAVAVHLRLAQPAWLSAAWIETGGHGRAHLAQANSLSSVEARV